MDGSDGWMTWIYFSFLSLDVRGSIAWLCFLSSNDTMSLMLMLWGERRYARLGRMKGIMIDVDIVINE